jgi:small ligand-binding sensory domain FIST
MPFTAALSLTSDTSQALHEVCDQVLAQMSAKPDLAMLFFSPHHAEDTESIARIAQERLGARSLLGGIGEAIVGNDQEVESRPALALWLAQWNRPVELTPFQLEVEDTSEGYDLLGWPDNLDEVDPDEAAIFLVGDPFSFPVDAFLQTMNADHPGLRVLGGMASGIQAPGQCRLLLGNRAMDHGAVGVLMQGPVKVRGIVSQGCRPIGRHMVVTKAEENVIIELGGKTPLAQMKELWQELSQEDRRLFQTGLHVGRVINEYQGEFQRGDFLIRNVLGLDQASGALAITDRVRVGQTVQFHVRDAASADEDLHALLQMDLGSHERRPGGALLFTCNGRGTRLFRQPHHDAQVIRKETNGLPLAGFFAQGELGPIGGQNFIHGFTASVVLFEE